MKLRRRWERRSQYSMNLVALIALLPVWLAAAPSLALSLQVNFPGLLNPLIGADPQDNIVVAGLVSDCSLPVVHPVSTCGQYWIAKLDPTGGTMLFATYLGDPIVKGQARGASLQDLRVDSAGNIVLLSNVSKATLPAVNAMQSTVKGESNLHLAKLSADGSKFLYATYLGGSGRDFGLALALDGSGAPYINVVSGSADFPVAPLNPPNIGVGGIGRFMVVKLSPDGQNLIYDSPFKPQYEGGSLRVDASGSAQLSTLSQIFKFSPDGGSVQTIAFPPWAAPYIPLSFLTPDGGYWLAGTASNATLPVTPNAVEPSDTKVPYLRIEQGQVYPPAQPMTGSAINAFAVDPLERFRIYAATPTGLFKSEDNGWIWDQVYPSGVQSVLVDPFDQNTLYIAASSYSPNGYLFRSTDRGQTWTAFAPDLTTNFGSYPIVLAADPNTPGKLYIAGGPVYRSEDGGQTWNGGWNGSWAPTLPPQIPDGSGQLSVKALGVTVDPSTPGRVYVTALTSCIGFCPQITTLARSDDGGATFTLLPYGFSPQIDSSTGDVFAPNFPAGQMTAFRGGNFGVPELLNIPGKIVSMAFDPENPGTIYVSLDTGAIFRSSDGGRSFQNFVTLPKPATLAVGDGAVIHASQAASTTDGFAFQLDALGRIVYGTYFGGGQTSVKALALTPNGHVFIAGTTGAGIPLANPIQPIFGGGTDAFVAELDASGALVSATYLGGPGNDEIDSITVLADGSVLAVGTTTPPAGPGQPPYSPPTPMIWRIAPA